MKNKLIIDWLCVQVLLCLLGCSSPPSGAELDAAAVDAGPLDAMRPDAEPQFCHHKIRGVFIGDTITQNLYLSARTAMQADGDVVLKIAVVGAKIEDQYQTWIASTLRGDTDIDWVFIQIGLYNIIGGGQTAEQDQHVMQVLLDDIHLHNPDAKVYLATMTPARGALEGITTGEPRFPVWQAANELFVNLGAIDTISQGLDDGTGKLADNYNQGDGLIPNEAANQASAAIVQAWLDEKFPDTPCKE